MPCNKSSKEYFTAYPNYYTDYIKPRLTDTQRDICDIVFRLSVGWQKSSARISNQTFVDKSGKSERAIITAKQQLINIGLLIMLEKAKSFTPALYAIDIYYDDPNKSIKNKHTIEDVTQSHTIPTEDILINSPVILATDYPSGDTNIPELLPQDEATTIVDIVEGIPAHDYANTPDTIHMPGDNSVSEYSETANSKLNLVQSRTEFSSAPYIDCTDLDLNKKKQTVETAPTEIPIATNIQASIREVCYNFTNLFPEAKEDSTWKFIGWCVNTYSIDKCVEKLEYMREYKKLHRVQNPMGLFRMALFKDYQPSKWITGMIRGRRRSEADIKRTQNYIAEMKTAETNIDWAAGAVALNNIIAIIAEKERIDG